MQPMPDVRKRITEFVFGLFPGRFLIHVTDFSVLIGESVGGVRNRIASGSFPVSLVKQGGRNYVSVIDVIDYLVDVCEGKAVDSEAVPVAVSCQASEVVVAKRQRRSKYGEEAKARAAAARAARQAKRAAVEASKISDKAKAHPWVKGSLQ